MQLLAKSLCLWLALLTASTASASGRFLSADPMGHDASMSLYDYCNGDPVNGLDPDGRLGKNAIEDVYNGGPGADLLNAGGNYLIQGLTGDGIIGTTGILTGRPIITGDSAPINALSKMGHPVRYP